MKNKFLLKVGGDCAMHDDFKTIYGYNVEKTDFVFE